MPNHANNVLNVATVSEKGVSGRGQDQCLNLGEIDTLKRTLEWIRNTGTRPPYL